ncbi:hypothetical protein [Mitsuokella sp. oral taxon 131]|uniref:hypothetical protein n=1 Tax=Mitsuokella sp. oral taxon 131 TaxID=1321780 RepID=UPI0003AE7A1F|nr:hypothetical protein [Mitsuokella sp. oral taxon 131]ERL04644.1 hypothetical protein HMPREF1985_01425 [Mitsuokella sp. oral taxon 131 str. W9106]
MAEKWDQKIISKKASPRVAFYGLLIRVYKRIRAFAEKPFPAEKLHGLAFSYIT